MSVTSEITASPIENTMDGWMRIALVGSRLLVRVAWILATVLTASTVLSIYHLPVGWLPAIAVSALALGAAFSSYNALLVIAGLGPLSASMFGLLRNSSMGLDFGEAMVLAFLAGCSARRVIRPQPLAVPRGFASAAAVLLSLTLASGIVDAAAIRTEQPDRTLADLTRYFLTQEYFVRLNTIRSTMLFAEGVALMVMAADACGGDRVRRDRLLRMMVVGATTAALFNAMKILTSAMLQPDTWSKFFAYFATARVNIHFPDLNAAGSYFALMLFVALGFVPRGRGPAVAAAVVIAAGLWMAGSRTALAAALGGACVAGLLLAPSRRTRAGLAIGMAALATVIVMTAWKLYPQGRNATVDEALAFRVLMGKAAVELTFTHPLFGVGLGHFPELSGIYQNNAHNNFLQISAELGIPALLAFVIIGWFAVRASWRDGETWGPAKGLNLGLAVFFLTCIAGHPLLVSGAAYPFWMAIGLAASVSAVPTVSRRIRLAGAAVILLIAVTLPFRVSAAIRDADVEHSSTGFSKWQTRSDGWRYRWAGGHASFFVAPAARAVRIPLALGPQAPEVVEVRLFLDGIEANRVVLRQGEDVRTVRLILVRRVATRFARIDLESRLPGASAPLDSQATDSAGLLVVGRPIFEQ